jgi:hypothetical protein
MAATNEELARIFVTHALEAVPAAPHEILQIYIDSMNSADVDASLQVVLDTYRENYPEADVGAPGTIDIADLKRKIIAWCEILLRLSTNEIGIAIDRLPPHDLS